jgi:hypothetical protein
MGLERKGKERMERRFGGRGKKGWNGDWEEGERQDQLEGGRKGKEKIKCRLGGR